MNISDDKLKEMISAIVSEMVSKQDSTPSQSADDSKTSVVNNNFDSNIKIDDIDDNDLYDITEIKMKDVMNVPNPYNKAEYLRLKAKTPARIGIYRAGPRYTTDMMVRFRADHAAACDAVFSDVSEEFIKKMDLLSVQTKATSRDEYLTRPDLGRIFTPEAKEIISKHCKHNPKVQIFAADGLSSTAIEANLEDVMPSLLQGLKSYGLEAGTPFFVKFGRVGCMDEVTEILNAEATVLLVGERPGLATSESMSAYMTYKGYPGMPEAGRTVISNIHSGGTPAVEAGAHIAHIVNEMLKQKASGLQLKI